MTSEQNTPAKSAQSTPSWIEATLFEPVFREIFSDFQQIKEFKVVNALGVGENYATVMLRLIADIELRDGATITSTLMLKTAHDSEAFKEMVKNQKNSIFDMETIMYRDIVPEFEKLYKNAGVDIQFAPKFYEIATEEPHLLLEDLKPKGYKNVNRLEGLDIKHTEAVLKTLAQWHAASAIHYPSKEQCPEMFLKNFFIEENRDMLNKIFGGITEGFLKSAKSYEGQELYYEKLCHHTENIIDDMLAVSKVDDKEFNVLNHGDCWSNNIMFKYDDLDNIADLYLVDYQIPHYGTPAQDLYYVLLSSTCYEIKLEKFDYFVRYYHECLVENLKLLKYSKSIPTLRELHIMLHKSNAWAYNTCTGVMAAVLIDPSDNAKLENYLSDSEDAKQFKLQLYSNARYRKHMEKLLPWLYYRGVF